MPDIKEIGLYGFIFYLLVKDVLAPAIQGLVNKRGETVRKPWEERLYKAVEETNSQMQGLVRIIRDYEANSSTEHYRQLQSATLALTQLNTLMNQFLTAQVQESKRMSSEISGMKDILQKIVTKRR
jgi:hypothetical protein